MDERLVANILVNKDKHWMFWHFSAFFILAISVDLNGGILDDFLLDKLNKIIDAYKMKIDF